MKSQSLPRFGNVFYLTSIAAACFLLLFGLATIIFGTRTYDVQITQDTIIQGRILASAVSAALASVATTRPKCGRSPTVACPLPAADWSP